MRHGCGLDDREQRWARAARTALLGLALTTPVLNACTHINPPGTSRSSASAGTGSLADQVQRLRAEFDRAEKALRSSSQASAVSSIASGRIQVERAARETPWRKAEVAKARSKLAEADRQLNAGRYGAAVFFVQRAESIAEGLLREARSARR